LVRVQPEILLLEIVSIPIRDLMNLNPRSLDPLHMDPQYVSIPIRDLMNLNLRSHTGKKPHSCKVSIPIRDLMNLNPYCRFSNADNIVLGFNPY